LEDEKSAIERRMNNKKLRAKKIDRLLLGASLLGIAWMALNNGFFW
jgi:hypothetical protein